MNPEETINRKFLHLTLSKGGKDGPLDKHMTIR